MNRCWTYGVQVTHPVTFVWPARSPLELKHGGLATNPTSRLSICCLIKWESISEYNIVEANYKACRRKPAVVQVLQSFKYILRTTINSFTNKKYWFCCLKFQSKVLLVHVIAIPIHFSLELALTVIDVGITLSAHLKRMRRAAQLTTTFILPIWNIAKVALWMGMRYSGISYSGNSQLMSRTGETPVASTTLRQSTTHDYSALLLRLLLLYQTGIRGAAGRCFLFSRTKPKKPTRILQSCWI